MGSSHSKLYFDGSFVKDYMIGPLINDHSINVLALELQKLINLNSANFLNDCKDLLEGRQCRKIEDDSANVEFTVNKSIKVCYIIAKRRINPKSELFISYGIKNYWYPILNSWLVGDLENIPKGLEKTFIIFKDAIQMYPEVASFLKPIT